MTTADKVRNGNQPRVKLPPISVAKFEEAMRLLERVVTEKTEIFIEKADAYRAAHRDGSTPRPLKPEEAAQVTAGLAHDLDPTLRVAMSVDVQESELRAYDEPAAQEVMMVAGVSTAPEFLDAVREFVALIEMDPDAFKDAREKGELDDAVRRAAADMAYIDLKTEGRPRAQAAMLHFSEAAGVDGSGEAWALISKAVTAALRQAMSAPQSESPISSLVDMGGDDSTSSIDSATSMQSVT